MRQIIENIFAALILVATEAWFLKGYFAGQPEFEPAIAFIAAAGALVLKDAVKARFTPENKSVAHDRALFEELLLDLPHEPTIRFLREHNFGDAFHTNSIYQLAQFLYKSEDVTREMLDKSLETHRKALITLGTALAQRITARASSVKPEGFLSLYSEPMRHSGPRPNSVLEDAKFLNETASAFVEKYEELVRLYKQRLLK
jgi:hypothetical protein